MRQKYWRGSWPKRIGRAPKSKAAYATRDEVLQRLGFVLYKQYLKSDLWKSIRASILIHGTKCELCCSVEATTAHHLSYRYQTMIGEDITHIVAVCDGCHLKVEFDLEGRKRSFEAAFKYSKKLLIKSGNWSKHIRFGPNASRDPGSDV